MMLKMTDCSVNSDEIPGSTFNIYYPHPVISCTFFVFFSYNYLYVKLKCILCRQVREIVN